MTYFRDFLCSEGLATDVTDIGPNEIRALILHLQQKRRFSSHRLNKPQDGGLSGHTINCYLRSIRAFWSWLQNEGIVKRSHFDKVRIPKPPRKVLPTFSDLQLDQLIKVINTATPEGYRDYAVILTLLDTGPRVSELCNMRTDNLWLEEGQVKVLGKGNKERLIPIGRHVQRVLWRYIQRYRPEPAAPDHDFLRGHVLLVACPKLDDFQAHQRKLTDILRLSDVKSLTVVHMEVPCCSGLAHMAKQAIRSSGKDIPFEEVSVGIRGDLKS